MAFKDAGAVDCLGKILNRKSAKKEKIYKRALKGMGDCCLETAYLLRSPRNAERLLTALGRALKNETSPQSIEELRKEVGFAGKAP